MDDSTAGGWTPEQAARCAQGIVANVGKVLEGKRPQVELALAAIIQQAGTGDVKEAVT